MEQNNKLGTDVPGSAKKDGTFQSRINIMIKECGSASKLARMAGVSESVIRKWKNGESEPTLSNLISLAHAGGKNIDWLATGKENYQGLEFPDKDKLVIKEDLAQYHSYSDWSEFAKIPLYDVEVSAGYGAVVDQEQIKGVIAFRQDWLRSKGLQQSKVITLTAKGDSMQPTIDHGDLLLVDCNTKNVTSDSIYVIRRDGHLFVKRLQQMISGDLYIKSDNPTYTQETIPKHEVKNLDIIGRVVWIGHEI